MLSAGVWWVILVLVPCCLGRATLDSNGYQDVLVAISPEEAEDPTLVEKIKSLLTDASAELYGASRQRAYFKSVTILVPQSWNLPDTEPSVGETLDAAEFRVAPGNPVYGNNPYTVQNGECGDPGDFTHLTSWFVKDPNATEVFGRTDKILVHEWAKLRWGVYEEYGYPGDEKFPMFYLQTNWGPNGQVDVLKPNFCTSTEVEGEAKDVFTGGDCSVDPDSGLPDNHCYYFPSADNKVASSYMALPFLDTVTDFCDDISEANLHHDDIPTKHNLYCDGKSTWAVIMESEDFINDANLPVNDVDTVPQFKIVQSKNPKYVVLMDISTSMMTEPDAIHDYGLRANNLRNAVKRWVTYEVTDGTEVALVVFSNIYTTFDPVIFHMAVVNDETRADMIKVVDEMEFDGKTCIGCGIDRALNYPGALKDSNGGVIILITDGVQQCEAGEGDTTVCKTIASMTPEVLARKTRVVTIAFGPEADPDLETLAMKSGGKSYFVDDYAGPGTINDAFTGSLTYQPGDVLGNTVTVVYQRDHSDLTSGSAVTGFFDIDQSIGREVSFQVEVKTLKGAECQAPLTIKLLRPDDAHTPEIDDEPFICTTSNLRMFRHSVANLAEEGRWVYKITTEEDLESLSIMVESKSKNPSTDPVMTRCWISTGSQEIDTTTNVKLAVVAEVTQGSKPVVGATITAVVERPPEASGLPQPSLELQLLDNGGGADKIKNDGTYARYFAKYTGKGRYSVKCQVSGDGDTSVNGGFTGGRVFPRVPDPHSPLCCGSDAMPPGSVTTTTGNFTRQAAGGSFRVTNEVDLNADNLPPGQVTDLKLTNLGDVVRVQFTAPGDDLDSSDAATEYIVKFSSTGGNLTGANFDSDKWNTRVLGDMLLHSDLDPIVGGSIKSFDICLTCAPFSKNEKYLLAMKAVDEAGNTSPVSNKAQLFIPDTSATTTTVSTTTAVSTTTTETPPECPRGWFDARSVDMGCLKLDHGKGFEWQEATVHCWEMDNVTRPHLVEVLSEQQQAFLVMALQIIEVETGEDLEWWTGGADLNSEGDWYWTHSRALVEPFGWARDRPKENQYTNCLSVSSVNRFSWVDHNCASNIFPICQF